MSHERFTAEWSRTRVVFAVGALEQLVAELDALRVARPLIVTTPGRAEDTVRLKPDPTIGPDAARLKPDPTIEASVSWGAPSGGPDRTVVRAVRDQLGVRLAGVCDVAALHVPADRVRAAVAMVDRVGPDGLLAVGGGSAIGLAKAIALERRLPIVAVPTTYAGSEMTSIWGVTDGEIKRTGRDRGVAPRLVVYDPALTRSLPAPVSAASGMNAIAHAVEALYARDAGPIAMAAADEAVRALARALPRVVAEPDNLEARAHALRGAHAAGVALELAAMGLHHKICHVLGGTFGLPHAPTHAAVLPHVVRFNAPAAPAAMARLAAALGVDDAAAGLAALNRALGLITSLGTLGLRADDVDRAAGLVTSSAYANPRPASEDDVRALLRGAL